MKNTEILISAEGLFKVYKLYRNPKDRLKESLSIKKKKYHKDFFALQDISLEIKKGEVFGIVGQNGSGKSTLLKILSKVLTPSKGSFWIKGKVSSLLELGSGFNPELSGIENVYFYATILGFSEDEIEARLDDIVSFADIGEHLYQPLRTYSSGMRARLAFSVAINVDPDILILDEVLAVGDELFRRKCYSRMETFFNGGKTILFVSHSVHSINELCTRAIFLDKGELILEGPPKLVTSQYERFLFANSNEKHKLRNEIKELNKDEEVKLLAYQALCDKREGRKENLNLEKEAQITKEADGLKESVSQPRSKAYYLPNLIPQSTLVYDNSDVLIEDVKITTPGGVQVNSLVTGEQYFYCYKVTFNINVENVAFGMMIKDEKGVRLSGTDSKRSNSILVNVSKGDVMNVKWRFVCNLLNGLYFSNAGVFLLEKGEIKMLTRVVDAIAFKVNNVKQIYGGVVYMGQEASLTRV